MVPTRYIPSVDEVTGTGPCRKPSTGTDSFLRRVVHTGQVCHCRVPLGSDKVWFPEESTWVSGAGRRVKIGRPQRYGDR